VSFWRESPVLRGAVYALGLVALIAFFVRLRHPGAPHADAATATVAAAPEDHQAAAHPNVNEHMILAECHPDLSPNTSSPPKFDVSRAVKPWAVSLKVRFWVNADGFVTKAFLLGGTVDNAEDQEAALHYIKGLTFQTPDTDECSTREIEINGEFRESADTGGEWLTVLQIHPRYSYQDGRLVESR
jgi:hypothetical protein